MSHHSDNHSHAASGNHSSGEHHTLPLNVYLKVFATLIFLTIITVWVAQFHFGVMNVFVAMGIATLKACLVGMYFMHLKYDNKLYATILVGSVGFLVLFWFFSYFDFFTRVAEKSTL
jgi:cytochrome c oxidase subunit IV